MLDEILDDPTGAVVLPVRLEESRSENNGQIVKIHLIEIRKSLNAANAHTSEGMEENLNTFLKGELRKRSMRKRKTARLTSIND